jgi:hypothetical protein
MAVVGIVYPLARQPCFRQRLLFRIQILRMRDFCELAHDATPDIPNLQLEHVSRKFKEGTRVLRTKKLSQLNLVSSQIGLPSSQWTGGHCLKNTCPALSKVGGTGVIHTTITSLNCDFVEFSYIKRRTMNSPLAESVGLTMACLYFAGGRSGTKSYRTASDRRDDKLSYSPVAVLPLANP